MKNSSLSPDEFDTISLKSHLQDMASAKAKAGSVLANGLPKNSAKKGDNKLKLFGEEYFINYELSWLQFNERVLSEALNKKNPLMERVKFIGIVCSNLDEFFQKRVGGLKRLYHSGVNTPAIDGMSPLKQLKEIRDEVMKMIHTYRSCFLHDLVPELAKNGVYIKTYNALSIEQRETVNDYFNKQLYPILTPLAVDEGHPFPFISNKSSSFAVELFNPYTGEDTFSRLKIPANRPRWVTAFQDEEEVILVPIEDVIQANLERLFPGMRIKRAHIFRVTRNADLERNEEEADDLLEVISEELRERRFAEIVRLEIDESTPVHIKEYLITQLNIKWTDVYEMNNPIGLVDAFQLVKIVKKPELFNKAWSPQIHPVFKHAPEEEVPDIFSLIRKGEFLVHHPYHSFAKSTQQFITEAVNDPKVLAIKQTLYRTSSDSPIMMDLMRAAEMGKQVAVLVEIKARFDEKQNIEWAQKLEKSGVHVSYGIAGIKIHTKLTVVVREEEDGIKRYVHIGTGNYHPGTAQLYEDFGLFSCNDELASDVTDVFNLLTGYAPEQVYQHLLVAPHAMRKNFEDLIRYEIEEAKAGRPARIIVKNNSLEDPQIIQLLYKASAAGVKIDLIIRGVCRLRAQVKGLSENIRVYSVIGRFLEHSRLFYFHHGGEDHYYMGSADWMHRNLDARIEAITPILEPELKKYMQFLLKVYLNDNQRRWELKADGSYKKIKKQKGEDAIDVHLILMHHTTFELPPVPRT